MSQKAKVSAVPIVVLALCIFASFVGGYIMFVMTLVGERGLPDSHCLLLHVLEPGAAGILGQVN